MLRLFLLNVMAVLFVSTGSQAYALPEGCDPRSVWNQVRVLVQRMTDGPCLNCQVHGISCDLKTAEKLPEVVFVSEANHHGYDIQAFRRQLIQRAVQGDVILATEISSVSNNLTPDRQVEDAKRFSKDIRNSQLHGIESPIPVALAISYTIQDSLLADNVDVSANLRTLLILTAQNPLAASAFEGTRGKISPELYRKLEKSIGKAGRGFAEDKLPSDLGIQMSYEELKKVADQMHISMIKIANKKYQAQLLGKPLPELLTKSDSAQVGFSDEGTLPDSVLWKVKVDLRDRDMSGSVAELLCENAGKRDFILVEVGNGHVPGMEKILGELSNGRLKTQVLEASEQKNRDAIMEMTSR